MLPAGELAAFLGGFVAAEGSFIRTGNRFRFAISLGATDVQMCEFAARLLAVGRVYRYPKRKPHFDDEVLFTVQSIKALVTHIVPFMNDWLPPSKKREQYLEWRRQLLDFWEHDARRRRPCTVDGCDRPQRGKGLCRHHYYAVFKR